MLHILMVFHDQKTIFILIFVCFLGQNNVFYPSRLLNKTQRSLECVPKSKPVKKTTGRSFVRGFVEILLLDLVALTRLPSEWAGIWGCIRISLKDCLKLKLPFGMLVPSRLGNV